MIKKSLKLEPYDFYKTHLEIVNSIFPIKLRKKELQVLAAFMSLEEESPFSPENKKLVMKKLRLQDSGLSNYLTSMNRKGFLKKTVVVENGVEKFRYKMLDLIKPNRTEQTYQFRIEKINQGAV